MDGAELRTRVLALASEARAEQEAFIAGLSAEARAETGTLTRWSAKDLVAHVAAWWQTQAERFALVASGQQPETFAWSDEVNAAVFARNVDRSWDEVAADAAHAFTYWTGVMRRLSPEDLLQPRRIRALGEVVAWRLVLGNGYLHPRLHLAEHLVERGDLARATRIAEEVAAARVALAAELVGPAHYDLACFYAKTGQVAEALVSLESALAVAPELRAHAGEDPDLVSLRGLPAFQRLLARE